MMGGGDYSYSNSVARRVKTGFASHSVAKSSGLASADYAPLGAASIFTQQEVHREMRSVGVEVREARDSAEHPNSFPIIIGLDVTGSMGMVPHHLVAEGFPKLMDKIIQAGVEDPQVMFLAIGDHMCDTTPLQVGQFESSDELLEKWLTAIYLEGGGGANAGESYPLAWYFAANHTAIDCWDKRKKKGLIFTIGDEPPLLDFPAKAITEIMGTGSQASDSQAKKLLDAAKERYEVFHIHVQETHRGRQPDSLKAWDALLGDHVLTSQHHDDVADTIATKILEVQGMRALPEEKTEEKADPTKADVEMM